MKILSFDVGKVNAAYCAIDSETKAISAWRLVSFAGGADTPTTIRATLEAHGLSGADFGRVLVERQPGKNKTMVRIEAYLHMYFVMTGCADVRTYHAAHKLEGTGHENSGGGASKYKARKNASVALAQAFLLEHPQAPGTASEFQRSAKRDDLADALMQAVSNLSEPEVAPAAAAAAAVRARKPTEKQLKTGNLTPANVKYVVQEAHGASVLAYVEDDPARVLEALVRGDKKLEAAVLKLFGSYASCCERLALQKDVFSKEKKKKKNKAKTAKASPRIILPTPEPDVEL